MCLVPFVRVCWCVMQLAKTKAADIESLLQQLSDINHDMGGVIAGAGDSRSHTLARHRDILTDLTQVCASVAQLLVTHCLLSAGAGIGHGSHACMQAAAVGCAIHKRVQVKQRITSSKGTAGVHTCLQGDDMSQTGHAPAAQRLQHFPTLCTLVHRSQHTMLSAPVTYGIPWHAMAVASLSLNTFVILLAAHQLWMMCCLCCVPLLLLLNFTGVPAA